MEKDISFKWKQKESWVAILISDKIDFDTKTVRKDKEGYYIMMNQPTERYTTYKYMHRRST